MKNLFPYTPRKGQISIMNEIHNAIEEEKIIMVNAPTGLGKTICSLVPGVESGKQILFVTPRKSQHDIVIQTAKDINKELSVACIKGKKDMCDNNKVKESSGFYEMCTIARKKDSKIPCMLYQEDQCRYYDEINKAKTANIITANYRHVFDREIGRAFMGLTQFNPENMILVVDEAHNLPQTLRDIASERITNKTCERAQREVDTLAKFGFESDINLAKEVADIIGAVLLFDDPKRRVDKSLFTVSDDALSWLKKAGNEIIDIKDKDGYVAPISYLLSLYKFFVLWRDVDDIKYIRVFERRSGNWFLSIKCLEPELLSSPLYKFSSVVLMSGTLQPIEYFRGVLGLGSDTILKSYPSIFPPENKTTIVNNNLTTQYKLRTTQMFVNYGEQINNICEREGNIAVFFPSYSLMKQVKSHIKTSKRIISESSGVKIDVHKELKSRDNLLLAVMRGTLAEGVDYKDNLLSVICIVGMPFPMQDIELKALTYYYDKKYGTGFVYASLYPTINVVLQAMGRGIRSETDKCVIHLLDKRFKNYGRWFLK